MVWARDHLAEACIPLGAERVCWRRVQDWPAPGAWPGGLSPHRGAGGARGPHIICQALVAPPLSVSGFPPRALCPELRVGSGEGRGAATPVRVARSEGGTSGMNVFQPPKEEQVEGQGHSGLTTLFPGQKRRISHLSKQGKEVGVPCWVLSGGWSGRESPSAQTRPLCSLPVGSSGRHAPGTPWVVAESCLEPALQSLVQGWGARGTEGAREEGLLILD